MLIALRSPQFPKRDVSITDAVIENIRVPVVLVTQVQNMWTAVWLVGLAAAAHQGWSANLFTTTSDMFPKKAVATIVGLGGMAGALGAMGILKLTGSILSATGSYTTLFLIAGSAYLVALGMFSHVSDAQSKGRGGMICIVDSQNVDLRPPLPPKDEDARFESDHNFKSTTAREALQFNAPTDWKWGNRRDLPYAYRPDPADEVPAIVKRGAGVGKLPDSVITMGTP